MSRATGRTSLGATEPLGGALARAERPRGKGPWGHSRVQCVYACVCEGEGSTRRGKRPWGHSRVLCSRGALGLLDIKVLRIHWRPLLRHWFDRSRHRMTGKTKMGNFQH